MKAWGVAATAAVFLLVLGPAQADEHKQQNGQHLPTVPLVKVLDAVAENTGFTFAVDRSAIPAVVIGQLPLKKLGYEQLLLVLRNNGLAAVRSSGAINIIPVNVVRQQGLPIVDANSVDIHDEEWVMRVIEVDHSNATMYVPILRPMLPQQAHMVANADANSLVIAARFATLKRLVNVVETLDQNAADRGAAQAK